MLLIIGDNQYVFIQKKWNIKKWEEIEHVCWEKKLWKTRANSYLWMAILLCSYKETNKKFMNINGYSTMFLQIKVDMNGYSLMFFQ